MTQPTDLSSATPPAGVTLELTGPLERAVGASEVTLAAASGDRLGDVLGQLVRQYSGAAEYLADEAFFAHGEGSLPPGLLVVRDGTVIAARLETPLVPGERLTLMPMISGG